MYEKELLSIFIPWNLFFLIVLAGMPAYAQSSYTYRLTNRKQISHILYEVRGRENFVTLIVSHSGPWAFHAGSHALHYFCGSLRQCLGLLSQLDHVLRQGRNIGLRLSGSRIEKIEFH